MRLFLPILFLLLACRNPERADDGRIPIAVSVPPQAYFVERIGGERVAVEVMIPPGASHEEHPLTPRKILALGRARLYVAVGHPAFPFETRYIDPYLAEHPQIRKIDMSRGMPLIEHGGPPADHGGEDHAHEGGDPHVWVAPETVAVAARNIARGLSEIDPAHAGEYRENLRRFLAEIDSLDREIRSRLARRDGPRGFIVYHPSWGYFARQYGLEQIAIEAEGKEPSAARMIELIERARRGRVKVVFVEGGFPRKSAQVIADAVGGRVVAADPQERDWAGNLRRVSAALEEALPHG